ncbi:DNA replication/repair protein RecF [Sedimenticola hydrogenitrophicus]|uniref:DNA replication/repair protein RecF n=1 Tax=Sedimenticola hydrogenitrophicus TaxID=2967975 RepID=UPI0023B0E65E
MTIKQIKIQHLRNITEADIRFSAGINLVTGKNGSGKSTLLEAIYMLGRGRSFRTSKFGPVVQHGEKSLTLFAISSLAREHRIGVHKSASQTMIKIDGEGISKLSDIAKMTPLQILTPMSHEILERGPEYRRRFVEWGVFHVEPSYYPIYKKFTKALRQRNSLLKTDPGTVSSWNQIVGGLGEEMNRLREDYFNLLQSTFTDELEQLNIDGTIEMTWKRGWDEGLSLAGVLKQREPSDIKQGYTQVGPHRADIRLLFEGRSAFTSISRGQQKMIISALHLAQAAITQKLTGIMPILLFDDLVAELDAENRDRLLRRINQIGCQAFITATDRPGEVGDIEMNEIRIESGTVTPTDHVS